MLLSSLAGWDQQIREWATSLGMPAESMLRLLLAALFGGLVGLEREVRGRQAGFRTYILVCLGSAIVMLVSTQFALHEFPIKPGINLNIDPARIAYGVMTGIGFLGAGTIVHNKGSVRGLTTAAGLWCVAAVGLAVGFGMYLISAIGIIIILTALWVLDYIEEFLPRFRFRSVALRLRYHPGCVADTVAKFKKGGLRVVDASFERSEDITHAVIHLHVAFMNSADYYNLERTIEADPDYHLLATREL